MKTQKIFKVADIRDLEKQVAVGAISYSRMVEMMNEIATNYFILNSQLMRDKLTTNQTPTT